MDEQKQTNEQEKETPKMKIEVQYLFLSSFSSKNPFS